MVFNSMHLYRIAVTLLVILSNIPVSKAAGDFDSIRSVIRDRMEDHIDTSVVKVTITGFSDAIDSLAIKKANLLLNSLSADEFGWLLDLLPIVLNTFIAGLAVYFSWKGVSKQIEFSRKEALRNRTYDIVAEVSTHLSDLLTEVKISRNQKLSHDQFSAIDSKVFMLKTRIVTLLTLAEMEESDLFKLLQDKRGVNDINSDERDWTGLVEKAAIVACKPR